MPLPSPAEDRLVAGGGTPEWLTELGRNHFPAHVGIDVTEAGQGRVSARLLLEPHHLAPNGFLHGGVVVSLADTACGYGCVLSLPEGARGFTTVELKANFLATTTAGTIRCDAELSHSGRSTQVWDAEVLSDDERRLAMFRCTQMILWPKDDA